jgi:methionine-rich copper-binding protein CopC
MLATLFFPRAHQVTLRMPTRALVGFSLIIIWGLNSIQLSTHASVHHTDAAKQPSIETAPTQLHSQTCSWLGVLYQPLLGRGLKT